MYGRVNPYLPQGSFAPMGYKVGFSRHKSLSRRKRLQLCSFFTRKTVREEKMPLMTKQALSKSGLLVLWTLLIGFNSL
jgi:hypothetical protein